MYQKVIYLLLNVLFIFNLALTADHVSQFEKIAEKVHFSGKISSKSLKLLRQLVKNGSDIDIDELNSLGSKVIFKNDNGIDFDLPLNAFVMDFKNLMQRGYTSKECIKELKKRFKVTKMSKELILKNIELLEGRKKWIFSKINI